MQGDGERGLAVDELRPGQFNAVALAFEREFQRRLGQGQNVLPAIDGQGALQGRVQWRHPAPMLSRVRPTGSIISWQRGRRLASLDQGETQSATLGPEIESVNPDLSQAGGADPWNSAAVTY